MEKDERVDDPLVRLFAKANHCQERCSWNPISFVEGGNREKVNSHIERFVKFCCERYTNPIQATTEMGIKFLTEYFETGVGDSSVNSARSALSSIIKPVWNVQCVKSPLVCRLLKDVFIGTALPRHVTTYLLTNLLTYLFTYLLTYLLIRQHLLVPIEPIEIII